MKPLLAILLLAPLVVAAQQVNNHPKPDPTPAPVQSAPERDHRGMCDGGGRAFTCVAVGSLAIYGVARAAGWEGFKYKWDGGKKSAEVSPMERGAMFTFSTSID